MTRLAVRGSIALVSLALASAAYAQDSKSAALAKQLTAALDAAKLDSIAAKDATAADTFCAALYFAGGQLLVVSAQYTAPQLLDTRVSRKEYRDTYIDLNSASVPASKVFIQDAGGDGLRARHADGQAADTYELAGKLMVFDGEWKKQKLSEQDYMKAFSSADERYAAILSALIEQIKK